MDAGVLVIGAGPAGLCELLHASACARAGQLQIGLDARGAAAGIARELRRAGR